MKKLVIAAAMLAGFTTSMSAPAEAQSRRDVREAREHAREERREARQAQRNYRQTRRDWRQYRNYDYNRYEPGSRNYYADRYYRDGSAYRERRLGRNDRVYRGSNGRYYCRRPDGTTGLIIGGAAGALLGNALDNGRSSLLGTLIGGGAGALLGREVERGSVRCR
ncbi:glycine zipper 2TM domain-containing protein [Sphingosinicella sp. BN140058]|uniref:glycine zipper 2TM domain-containing protein n=1 Tax=Sphingosinicella sp. BN140058 TaxID=1892855 RepID=UPI001010C5FD|nr:glycine zipper 2TM domain-containing protein [Sphingosinicella sp. BN140058]QAY79227.1 glycine zipper 2TM domain-containing protein [Sphingosinicella sp. BN140058]